MDHPDLTHSPVKLVAHLPLVVKEEFPHEDLPDMKFMIKAFKTGLVHLPKLMLKDSL